MSDHPGGVWTGEPSAPPWRAAVRPGVTASGQRARVPRSRQGGPERPDR